MYDSVVQVHFTRQVAAWLIMADDRYLGSVLVDGARIDIVRYSNTAVIGYRVLNVRKP